MGLRANCVGLWRMNDDAVSKTVKDRSREGNDGQAEQNTEDLHTTGKINSALDFNGSSDFITVSDDDSLDFGTGDFSIAIWFKSSNDHNGWYFDLVDKRTGNDGFAFCYKGFGGGVGRIWFKIRGTSNTGAIDIPTGGWCQLIAVRSSGTTTIYVNNVEDVNVVQAGTVTNSEPVRIGYHANIHFNGKIDVTAIFNKALSEAEREFLWNGGDGREYLGIARPLINGSLASGMSLCS